MAGWMGAPFAAAPDGMPPVYVAPAESGGIALPGEVIEPVVVDHPVNVVVPAHLLAEVELGPPGLGVERLERTELVGTFEPGQNLSGSLVRPADQLDRHVLADEFAHVDVTPESDVVACARKAAPEIVDEDVIDIDTNRVTRKWFSIGAPVVAHGEKKMLAGDLDFP